MPHFVKLKEAPDEWRMPDDRIWALREASKQSGFMPHARSTVEFLYRLEREGLVRQSDYAPIWFATRLGKEALEKLES